MKSEQKDVKTLRKSLRQSLERGAKFKLQLLGLRPTRQAARAMVDRELKRLKGLNELHS